MGILVLLGLPVQKELASAARRRHFRSPNQALNIGVFPPLLISRVVWVLR